MSRAREYEAKTAILLEEAEREVQGWAQRFGRRFAVSSGRVMCSPLINMPDGTRVHRAHLMFLRTHGLVSFEHLAPGTVVTVE